MFKKRNKAQNIFPFFFLVKTITVTSICQSTTTRWSIPWPSHHHLGQPIPGVRERESKLNPLSHVAKIAKHYASRCKHLGVGGKLTLASWQSVQGPQNHTISRSLMHVPSMPFCSRILPRTLVLHHRFRIGTNWERAYIRQLSPRDSAFFPKV